jgi:myo-inositol-1-phosphate synthase
VAELKRSGADVLMNYLPVGSQKATEFYAECALEAGVAFVNNIPVFIASDPVWAKRFEDAGVAIIGDDIKAQLGATIVHRVLTDLFAKRGVKLERTYQLNTGGNTDFLNMSNHKRLASKKVSKTEAVQSVAAERMDDDNVHIGPSDYVPWQNDNKVCFLRMEGSMFGGVPMNLELRLSVEDSPNSAGVAIDMIRCAKIARDRGIAAWSTPHPRISASIRASRPPTIRPIPRSSSSSTKPPEPHRDDRHRGPPCRGRRHPAPRHGADQTALRGRRTAVDRPCAGQPCHGWLTARGGGARL